MPEPATPPPLADEALAYTDALAELDQILRELEGSDVDVDRLADRVARAATLIEVCRDRIARARLRIEEVVAELDDDAAAGRDPSQESA